MTNPYIFAGLPLSTQAYLRHWEKAQYCGKPDCYFCEVIYGTKPITEYRQPKPEFISGYGQRWNDWEIQYLVRNYIPRDQDQITKLAQHLHRTRRAIRIKYCISKP